MIRVPKLPTSDAQGAEARKTIWLVSFTDLMSLLLAFFVLMFSMSEPQVQRWARMAQGLSARSTAAAPSDVAPVPSAAFNAAALERNRYGAEIRQLASPVLGTGVMVGLLERLFLLAELRREDPAPFVWTVLSERGKRLRRDGAELQTDAENVAELARLHEGFAAGQRRWLEGLGIAGA